ncbi:MAG: hypothetical protein M3Y04_00150, partial [Actinomycetota bacterium]|nr:hypothetical protein [Actinomycetota bacterium]
SGPASRSEGRSGPASRSEGRSGPGRDWRSWPGALLASIAFGVVGAILMIAGLTSRATPVLVAATTAGSLSLVAALVWRSQLIEAWRKEKGMPTKQW